MAKEPGSVLSVPFTVIDQEPKPIHTDDDESQPNHHESDRIGFEPLPLAMRPDDHDSQAMGIIIDNIGRRRKRQYPDIEEVSDGARVIIGFQKSATLGLGSVYCWVDDNQAAVTRVEGWWDIEERNMGM